MKFFRLLTILILVTLPSNSFAACPPIKPGSVWVSKDKKFAKKRLLAKAKRLNDSGKCVIEGGFGRNYNQFYFGVTETGDLKDAKILKFTYEELSK